MTAEREADCELSWSHDHVENRMTSTETVPCTSCGHAEDDHIDHDDGRGSGCMRLEPSDIRGSADECGCLFYVVSTARRYCPCVEMEDGQPVGFVADPDCPDHGLVTR